MPATRLACHTRSHTSQSITRLSSRRPCRRCKCAPKDKRGMQADKRMPAERRVPVALCVLYMLRQKARLRAGPAVTLPASQRCSTHERGCHHKRCHCNGPSAARAASSALLMCTLSTAALCPVPASGEALCLLLRPRGQTSGAWQRGAPSIRPQSQRGTPCGRPTPRPGGRHLAGTARSTLGRCARCRSAIGREGRAGSRVTAGGVGRQPWQGRAYSGG